MPANKLTVPLYGGEIVIDFYPDSHRYKLQGNKDYLISATACTGIIDKSRFLIPWAVGLTGAHLRSFLESATGPFQAEELYPVIEEALKQHEIKKTEAASIGEQVHAYAESFAKACLAGVDLPGIPEGADERVIAGINGFLSWFTENHVEFMHAEKLVYSKAHGFVGIADAIATVNGKKTLIDYKTSKGIYNEMRYQVAAYRMAYEEEHGSLEGALILHFDKETGLCNTKPFTDEDQASDAPIFLACYTIKKREKELLKLTA